MNCPYCGQRLKPEDDKCPNCNAPVRPGEVESSSPQQTGAGKGARVIAKWGNGLWYPGTIDDERGASKHVTFDDGDEAWVGPRDITEESDPADDGGGKLAIGTNVMGLWENRQWYPGAIDERFGRVWRGRFNDGDEAWMGSERLKTGGGRKGWILFGVVLGLALVGVVVVGLVAPLFNEEGASTDSLPILPLVPLPNPPQPGTRVLAPFGQGAYYFVGNVRSIGADGQVEVLFLDGDQARVPAPTLRLDNIGPGTLVSARSSRGEGWYSGQVRAREADRAHVFFDDGDVEWVGIHHIRVPAPGM